MPFTVWMKCLVDVDESIASIGVTVRAREINWSEIIVHKLSRALNSILVGKSARYTHIDIEMMLKEKLCANVGPFSHNRFPSRTVPFELILNSLSFLRATTHTCHTVWCAASAKHIRLPLRLDCVCVLHPVFFPSIIIV